MNSAAGMFFVGVVGGFGYLSIDLERIISRTGGVTDSRRCFVELGSWSERVLTSGKIVDEIEPRNDVW